MQIGINDLDDDDFGTGFEVNNNPPEEEDINPHNIDKIVDFPHPLGPTIEINSF